MLVWCSTLESPLGAIRLLLACVFAASGTAKIFDLPRLQRVLSAAKLGRIGSRESHAVAICVIELVMAFGLVAGIGNAAVAWGAFAFLIAATLVLIRLRQVGYNQGCNCFGELSERPIGPALFWRNGVLLGAAMFDGLSDAFCPSAPLWVSGGVRATLLIAAPVGTAIVVAVCTQLAAPRRAAPGL
jgi:uncharacterized membrane protein YphA (DoxX/SURF4 family)